MRAPISVVIPCLNAQGALPACAASLIEGLDAGLIREMIVSDGGSVDGTKRIADEIGARWVEGAASRGGQLKRGCAVAQGEWILVLHADTQLEAGWCAAVTTHLQGTKAGYFQLEFDAPGLPSRVVAGWANLRSRVFALPYGDQGVLISRALYNAVGGYEDMQIMEDVALARALKRRLVGIPVKARTSAEKYQSAGWLRRGRRNLWTLLRYFVGVPVEKLAQSYRQP